MTALVHIRRSFGDEAVCGAPCGGIIAGYRERVTCEACRKSPQYHVLPRLPARFKRRQVPA